MLPGRVFRVPALARVAHRGRGSGRVRVRVWLAAAASSPSRACWPVRAAAPGRDSEANAIGRRGSGECNLLRPRHGQIALSCRGGAPAGAVQCPAGPPSAGTVTVPSSAGAGPAAVRSLRCACPTVGTRPVLPGPAPRWRHGVALNTRPAPAPLALQDCASPPGPTSPVSPSQPPPPPTSNRLPRR